MTALPLPPKDSAIHRLPPYDLEAELAVLGALMLAPDLHHEIRSIVSPDDFWRESHQILARRIFAGLDKGRETSLMLLRDDLARSGDLDRVGGQETLLEALRHGETHWLAPAHADIVRRKAILRRLIEAAARIMDDAYSDRDDDARAVAARAETLILAASEGRSATRTVDWREAAAAAMERIDARRSGKAAGRTSGIPELDEMVGGLGGGRLIVAAARPGMGKTALALNIAEWAAARETVFIASKEMGATELAERSLASASGIGVSGLQKARYLDATDMRRLDAGYEAVRGLPIVIDDSAGGTVADVAAHARRIKSRSPLPLGLVVVDYIQLLESDPDGKGSRESRQEAVSRISRRLKTLARELDVPVLALSQLNRAVEAREDRRPRMSDLRESGAIEQDADQVVLIHRPEYYDPNDNPGTAELIVAKNRHGATGTVKVAFVKHLTRFCSLAQDPGLDGEF